jgi:hypothetical protein
MEENVNASSPMNLDEQENIPFQKVGNHQSESTQVSEMPNSKITGESLENASGEKSEVPLPMHTKMLSIQFGTLEIEFATAIEALEKCLHIPGFTNDVFKQIIKLAPLTPQQFMDWVEMQLNIYFGSKVTMMGKVVKVEKDNDILLTMHYFCETVEYNPEKVFLILNRHNTEIIRDIISKVGIGTMMLFHSLKAVKI